MASRVTQGAKVGIFVLLSAAIAYLIYTTVTKDIGPGKSYTVWAQLEDATGLATRTRVSVAGIPIGTIDKITLQDGRARIDLKIKGDVDLYENATIGKKSVSLLGESVIVLTPGTKDHPRLKDGDEIKIRMEFATTDTVVQQIAKIAEKISAVADQLANSIGTQQGGENMRRILQNLADATEALNVTIRENRDTIRTTLNNVNAITVNSGPQLAKILENVRVITEDVKVLVSQAGGKDGQPGELRTTIERLNRSSKSLESALEHVDHIAERMDKGEGTLGRLSKDETLINEVQGVAEGVNDYVGGITRLQTIVGLRTDYNFLANTIKSFVEVRLQPREDKYYAIELINDPRGKTSFTQSDIDTTDPRAPGHYRTITTTTTDAFRFSIQIARRLGPVTGRFGIKESSGGVGLDLHLLRDRFELRQDLFGFGEEIQPRYRVYLGYEFIKRLWLLAGIDHLFLPNRRDYFLGLQLRFNDEDLKTILPFGGSAVR
jgi:phospholipid/cholesterol/gamma-HCH transport system substrate-binding protein